jgi:hypothetical protein
MSKDLAITSNPEPPLSTREAMRLAALEKLIVQDFSAFIRVGQALAEINESRLYRITTDGKARSFGQYCKEIHDMAKGSAHRYIAAAQTYENVSHWETNQTENNSEVIEMLPVNERQIRPLTRLKPEQQAIIWQTAVKIAKSSKGGKPTAALVKRVVDDYLGQQVVDNVEKAKRQQQSHTEKISPEFLAAFDALRAVINQEAKAGWPTTDKDDARRYIKSLAKALEG